MTIGLSVGSAQEKQDGRQPPPRYTDASGAIQIVGNDGMDTMLKAANTLFTKTHPDIRFAMYLHGSSTAMPALTSGISAFAPMGRDIWPNDRTNFKNTLGYEPIDIKIGYAGWGPREGFKTPPSVYVNQSNHLPGLTLTQLRQVLTTGAADGDIRTWSQIEKDPKAVSRQIHVYGISDNGGFASAFRISQLQGLPFTSHYETLPNAREVMRAVASDANGIGLVGWFDASKTPGVRLLPIAAAAGQPFATPSQEDLRADRYPLTSYLHIYINKPPGQSVAPWLVDYLNLLLSPAGQAIIAQEQSKEGGFLPLSEAMRQAELEKVERLRQP
ncbi:substrate-binding domain-containing protein [Robbsia sp. KACC 23696]|uniref:PstS family phosphate ABC transporter substrate-binding protein n=1 Tax=Robbsia sp. KACC 23696 TaxID=3149231 RepID=UPI00325A8D6C